MSPEFIVTLAQKYPWIITVLAAVGALRTIFKPAMSWLQSRVAATPDTADDARLERVQHSLWYAVLAWLLDYTASIKIGPQVPGMTLPIATETNPDNSGADRP